MPSVSVFDKGVKKGRREYSAGDYVRGLKILENMNKMLPMRRVKNSLDYCEEHPYWRGRNEEREKALRIMEAQMQLLRVLFPRRGDDEGDA